MNIWLEVAYTVIGIVVFFLFLFALKPRIWPAKRDWVVVHLINKKLDYIKYVDFPAQKIEYINAKGKTEIYYYVPDDIYEDDVPKAFRTKHFRYIDVYQGNPFASSHRKKQYWYEWQRLDSEIDTDQTVSGMSGSRQGWITTQLAIFFAVALAGIVGSIAFVVGYIHP